VTVSDDQLHDALEEIEDGRCPIDHDVLDLEVTVDEIGEHRCMFCDRGHVWSLQRNDWAPAADMVADALEGYLEPQEGRAV
jgi:hypothetical protein